MKFITDYWAQLTVIIGCIGFVLKTIIESYNKKKEIRFSRLHENKILEIKNYYKSYQKLRVALLRLHFQLQFRGREEEILKKLGENIAKRFIKFEYNSMTVKLFIDPDDVIIIDEIMKNLSKIDLDLRLTIIQERFPTTNDLPERLEAIFEIFKKTLPELMNKIEINLRENFK